MITYVFLWFPMLIIAVANGAFREWYRNYTDESRARQMSTILLIFLFGIYIAWVVNVFPPASDRQAILIGVLWFALTLLFEFGFGWYRKIPWSAMLEEYNLVNGKLWALVPLWVAIAPYLLSKLL